MITTNFENPEDILKKIKLLEWDLQFLKDDAMRAYKTNQLNQLKQNFSKMNHYASNNHQQQLKRGTA